MRIGLFQRPPRDTYRLVNVYFHRLEQRFAADGEMRFENWTLTVASTRR